MTSWVEVSGFGERFFIGLESFNSFSATMEDFATMTEVNKKKHTFVIQLDDMVLLTVDVNTLKQFCENSGLICANLGHMITCDGKSTLAHDSIAHGKE